MPLPPEYSTVENKYSTRTKSSKVWAPKTPNFQDIDDFAALNNAVSDELSWLIKFICDMDGETLPPAWSGYRAALKRGVNHPSGITEISQYLVPDEFANYFASFGQLHIEKFYSLFMGC